MFWPTLVSKFGEGSFTIGSIIQTTISHFSTDFDYKGKKTRNKTPRTVRIAPRKLG